MKIKNKVNQNRNDQKDLNDKALFVDVKMAILDVVAFFSMFKYPLNFFEIWNYIGVKCEVSLVQDVLGEMMTGGKLKSYDGFYFLAEAEINTETRLRRYNYVDRKMKKAMRICRLFKMVPWVKMVAVGNIIGAHNMRDGSDIDFFIVTERKRIWISRFFCTGIAALLGVRPSPGFQRDSMCLSFYVDEDSLDLQKMMSESCGEVDMYLVHWVAGLSILYDRGGEYKKFQKVNEWIYKFLPNWAYAEPCERRIHKSSWTVVKRDVIDMFVGGLDPCLARMQMLKFPGIIKDAMNIDSRVIVNDCVLKFHVNDRREEFNQNYLRLKKSLR